MSEIARRLTGMSEKDFFEYNFTSINSIEEVFGIKHCRDPRIYAGLIIGPGDLNKEREWLMNNIPKALRIIKK